MRKRRIFLFQLGVTLFVMMMPAELSAQPLSRFSEQIFWEADGSARVFWDIYPAADSLSSITLPWNFITKTGDDIQFLIQRIDSQSCSYSASAVKKDGIFFVRISGRSLLAPLRVSFTVPRFFDFTKEKIADFGNFTLKQRFINTSIPRIDQFSSEIILPAGMIVTSVDETIPKQTEDNPVSPFSLVRRMGRNSVILRASPLKLGDHAFIKMQIKNEQKSSVLLITMSIVGILYLIFFRDLVRKENGKSNSKNS